MHQKGGDGYESSASSIGDLKDMMTNYMNQLNENIKSVTMDVNFLKRQQNLLSARRPEPNPSKIVCRACHVPGHLSKDCPTVVCTYASCLGRGHTEENCYIKMRHMINGSASFPPPGPINHRSGNERPPGPSWSLLQRGDPNPTAMPSSSMPQNATHNPSVNMIDLASSSVRAITRKGKERVVEEERNLTPAVATHPPTHVAVPVPTPLPKPRHVRSRPMHSKSIPPTLSFDLVSALDRVELTMSLPQYLLASPANRALLRRYCKAMGSSQGVSSISPAVQRVDSLLAERECPRVECMIHQLIIPHTIVDGGSGVNVLSYSTFTKLGLSFNGVPVSGLRMGDHRAVRAEGFIQGLPITVAGHTVDIDCYVLRLSPGPGQYQLLLGRPWIWKTDCVIDIPRGHLLLGRGLSRVIVPA